LGKTHFPAFYFPLLVFLFIHFSLFSLLAFSALTLEAFQSFTRKHCMRILGLRLNSATWNRFPIKKHLLVDSASSPSAFHFRN